MADPQFTTRTLDGFSGYLFRSDGEVVTVQRGAPRILRGGTDKDGYRKFVLMHDSGERRHVRRASMICEAFHGPRPDGMTVRHLDGSRTNDAASNLAWGTQKENIADKLRHGTAQRGNQNPRAKLTEAQVRELLAMERVPYAVLARRWGVTRSAIYTARMRRSWRWLCA